MLPRKPRKAKPLRQPAKSGSVPFVSSRVHRWSRAKDSAISPAFVAGREHSTGKLLKLGPRGFMGRRLGGASLEPPLPSDVRPRPRHARHRSPGPARPACCRAGWRRSW
jgi:hypothetical protein